MKNHVFTSLILLLMAVLPASAQMVGIGITIEHNYGIKIADIIENSAADTKGIEKGQLLLAVNGIYLDDFIASEIYYLICGQIGENVKLTTRDLSGNEKTFTIKRKKDNNGELSSAHEKAIIGRILDESLICDLEDLKQRGKQAPKDSDKDGVSDYYDECPTMAGNQPEGCPEIVEEMNVEIEPAPEPAKPIKDNADRTSAFGSALHKVLDDAKNGFKNIKVAEKEEILGTAWTVNVCLPGAVECKVSDGLSGDYNTYNAEFLNQTDEETANAKWEELKNKVQAALGSAYTASIENTDYHKLVTFTCNGKPAVTISTGGTLFYTVDLKIVK